MPHDFPQLVGAIVKGLVIGVIVVAAISGWRWLHGQPLRPQGRKRRVHELPIWLWILGIFMFGGASVGSLATHMPSFSVAFGVAALLYLSGLVYTLIVRRRVGLTNR